MDYKQALDYLMPLTGFGVRLRLDHMRKLLGLLGNPDEKLSCVLVAGTNGKGSVACMISSVLSAAGCKTGLYTSPAVVSFTDRIRINGVEISERQLSEYVSQVKTLLESVSKDIGSPTFFEVVTAVALKHFSDEKVDYCVLEVGMGGRLDATNAVNPLLSVITSIGLDHTEFLGESIEKIALEKAGIVRDNRPLVCGQFGEEALSVIEENTRASKTYVVGRDVSYAIKELSTEGTLIDYSGFSEKLKGVSAPLAGVFQASNIATALCAIEVLKAGGVRVSEGDIRAGLANARWPGRFEVLGAKAAMVLDGAHNPPAFRKLSESLNLLFPKQQVVFLLSVLDYKDLDGILTEARKTSNILVATESSHPRALSTEKIVDGAREKGFEVVGWKDPVSGLGAAKRLAGSDGVVCVCGSLFLVGDIKKYLAKQ